PSPTRRSSEPFAAGGGDRCVLAAPDRTEAQRLFDTYHQALTGVMDAAGTDVEWGRNTHQVMLHAGLDDVDTYLGGARSWHGGQAGCLLPHAMTTQMRTQLLHHGMNQADLDQFRQLLHDPRLTILNPAAISTTGRR